MRRIWRPLVMTSDKLASSYALERRSPCLARDLIEFSYRLPAEHKISDPAQGRTPKAASSASNFPLPPEIRKRAKRSAPRR
ncbi:asparagine synthase-related protein [Streptomyces sp. NPDC088106]|uniref:asparagine synthase-related protein n=1 Tax=unclassified Streptomyces TaxID=2593676 RepID=UPI00342683B0